ncbi:hypothetical protein DFH07DRAFT_990264 [Mycena maculata]|uniref:F-box domain-containing protein n=1 Tax=Mycena maculata TaxID=230809 RepID=A0AAD7JZJ7_9AGAR|nr:hypothetical protein DFH07DRAFT_990264 [Mycena maculata]
MTRYLPPKRRHAPAMWQKRWQRLLWPPPPHIMRPVASGSPPVPVPTKNTIDLSQSRLPPPTLNMNPNSPITRLPHDILHDIFVTCIEDAVASDAPHFAVVLSHVCASWRTSALASPAIWSTINTDSPIPKTAHLRSKAYFERSREMRVSVVVAVSQPSCHMPEFALLACNAHRIRKLVLVCSDPQYVPGLMGCLTEAMPALETFMISANPDNATEFTVQIAAPDARERCAPEDQPPFRLPAVRDNAVCWSTWATANVTQLSFNGLQRDTRPSLESLWHILTGCKSTLQTLEFKGWAPLRDDENSVLEPVVLPMLYDLELFFVDDLSPLAALISAPGLLCLTLQNGRIIQNPYSVDEDTDFVACDVPSMLGHLSASAGSLLYLYLYALDDCPRSAVDSFFASMPNLYSIMLCEADEAFQAALFQPESRFRVPQEIVFPVLADLSSTSTLPSDLGRFLLRHKTLPVAPLQSVFVTDDQLTAAYMPTRGILGVILDLCMVEHGLQVISVAGPRRIYEEVERDERE